MSLKSFRKSFLVVCYWWFDRFRLAALTSSPKQSHIFLLFCKIKSGVLAYSPLSIILRSCLFFLLPILFFQATLFIQTKNSNAFDSPEILLFLFYIYFPSLQIWFHLLCFSISFFSYQRQEEFYLYILQWLWKSSFHKLSN